MVYHIHCVVTPWSKTQHIYFSGNKKCIIVYSAGHIRLKAAAEAEPSGATNSVVWGKVFIHQVMKFRVKKQKNEMNLFCLIWRNVPLENNILQVSELHWVGPNRDDIAFVPPESPELGQTNHSSIWHNSSSLNSRTRDLRTMSLHLRQTAADLASHKSSGWMDRKLELLSCTR